MSKNDGVFKVPAPRKVQPQQGQQVTEPTQEKIAIEDTSEIHKDTYKKSLALKAAGSMVGQVAPAQLERAVTEAASYIYSLKPDAQNTYPEEKHELVQKKVQPIQLGNYQIPDWGGPPSSYLDPPYSIEILKSGCILEHSTLDSNQKGYYTFGKLPDCDFILEHPSCSRFHAVIQFNSGINAAFVWDNGSTHGTFLNKQRIKQAVYVPVQVGDMIVFGMSSRKYVLGGPDELRPEEGLNRQQKRQLAMLKAADKIKEKDKMRAEVQMQAALKGDVTWGMKEDAVVDEDNIDDNFDWRTYADIKGLTEKQQKLAQKIRSKDWKIQSLEKEVKRIKMKSQKELGLTPGQAATLARNEQSIEKLQEEKEDLEELLIESIKDSIDGKKKKAEEDAKKAKGKRKKADSEDEYLKDDDDEFYDRTGQSSKLKQKTKKQKVLSPESLYGEKSILEDELAVVNSKLISLQFGELHSTTNSDINPEDQLDFYMQNISESISKDNLSRLQQRQQQLQTEIQRLENLLKISDPQGYYKPGSKIALAAKMKAAKEKEAQLKKDQLEQQLRKEQESKQMLQEYVCEQNNQDVKQTNDAQLANNSNDKEQQDPGRLEGETGNSGGLEIRTEKQKLLSIENNKTHLDGEKKEDVNKVDHHNGGTMQQPYQEQKSASIGLLSRQQLQELHNKPSQGPQGVENNKKMEMDLEEELSILARATQVDEDQSGAEFQTQKTWRPPKGQTGDGRSELNEKFGY